MNKGKEEGLRAGDKLVGPEATGKESHWRREMIRLVFQKGPVSSSAGMLDGPRELAAGRPLGRMYLFKYDFFWVYAQEWDCPTRLPSGH